MHYVLANMSALQKAFFRRLDEEETIYATRCRECEELYLPLRNHCPFCGGARFEWVALSGLGQLYAFTQQPRALRFAMPDVVGLVQLDEGVTAFGVIEEVFDLLTIGDCVQATVVRDGKGPPVLGFKPVVKK